MNNTPEFYKIETFKSDDLILELATDVINKLNLTVDQPTTLKFGNLSVDVRVVPKHINQSPGDIKIRLSKSALNELRLPANITVSIKPGGENRLRLGPVIGILTFGRVINNQSFGFYLRHVQSLKSGLLYVFGCGGVTTKTKTVHGYYYDPAKKTWVSGDFPYPDVVMDRCYPNPYRTHLQLERVIGKGKIFNKKTMISKLDFFKALRQDNYLINHLPETRILGRMADIKYFLNKYSEIFLKPVHGMKGSGIVTISSSEGRLNCSYMAQGTKVEEKLASSDQIIRVLNGLGFPKRSYIIQNAIPRMEYQGRPFCFRVMACKNGNGQWQLPAIFPKAATSGGFLTNHASGAGFVPLKDLFTDISGQLPYNKQDFINLLFDLTHKTALVLDKMYGPLGELGIDIIVDQSGKPWLLEANGNPGLVPWSHTIEFPDWRYQSFTLPMSYAVYLAGF